MKWVRSLNSENGNTTIKEADKILTEIEVIVGTTDLDSAFIADFDIRGNCHGE